MENDRIRWNGRYRGEGYLLGVTPSPFLAEQLELLLVRCPGREALDVACGEGRNSVFLARNGFRVTGIDIAEEGLDKGRALMAAAGVNIDFIRADLDSIELVGSYDLILNFNFLLRGLIPKLVSALTPGGILVFDTLLDAPGAPPTQHREHLLRPGELSAIFSRFSGVILLNEELPAAAVPTARLMFQSTVVRGTEAA